MESEFEHTYRRMHLDNILQRIWNNPAPVVPVEVDLQHESCRADETTEMHTITNVDYSAPIVCSNEDSTDTFLPTHTAKTLNINQTGQHEDAKPTSTEIEHEQLQHERTKTRACNVENGGRVLPPNDKLNHCEDHAKDDEHPLTTDDGALEDQIMVNSFTVRITPLGTLCYQCYNCSFFSMHLRGIQSHGTIHGPNANGTFCPICNWCVNAKRYKQHVDKYHPTATHTKILAQTKTNSLYPKPPMTQAQIIVQAIESAPGHQITSGALYSFVSKQYPYYAPNKKGWQNSFRRTLNTCPKFIRLLNPDIQSYHKYVWIIDPTFDSEAIKQSFKKKRQNAVKSNKFRIDQ